MSCSLRAAHGCRVQNVLLLLRDGLPDAHIILLGILPRDAVVTAPTHAYQWPNRMSDAIMLTNFEYEVGSWSAYKR